MVKLLHGLFYSLSQLSRWETVFTGSFRRIHSSVTASQGIMPRNRGFNEGHFISQSVSVVSSPSEPQNILSFNRFLENVLNAFVINSHVLINSDKHNVVYALLFHSSSILILTEITASVQQGFLNLMIRYKGLLMCRTRSHFTSCCMV